MKEPLEYSDVLVLLLVCSGGSSSAISESWVFSLFLTHWSLHFSNYWCDVLAFFGAKRIFFVKAQDGLKLMTQRKISDVRGRGAKNLKNYKKNLTSKLRLLVCKNWSFINNNAELCKTVTFKKISGRTFLVEVFFPWALLPRAKAIPWQVFNNNIVFGSGSSMVLVLYCNQHVSIAHHWCTSTVDFIIPQNWTAW